MDKIFVIGENFSLGLTVSLLIRHQESDTLLVNFDPLITQLIRETDCLLKMSIDVPEPAKQVYQKQEQLKQYQDSLRVNINTCVFVVSNIC